MCRRPLLLGQTAASKVLRTAFNCNKISYIKSWTPKWLNYCKSTCTGSPFFHTIASVVVSHINLTSSPIQPSGISNSNLNQCVLHLSTQELNTTSICTSRTLFHATSSSYATLHLTKTAILLSFFMRNLTV